MNQLVPETSAKVEFNYSTDKSQKNSPLCQLKAKWA